MTDSSSFSSLLALVDSHLSKVCLQESRSEDGNSVSNRIPIPHLGPQPGTVSDTSLSFSPGQRFPLPSFKLSESPIQNVLAEQVANMLRAKELKKKQDEENQRIEEEKQREEEEIKRLKLEEEECVIDLMQALKTPCDPRPPIKEEVLSSSSSFESLFEPKFIDCDTAETKSPEPLLPCITDMTYILHQKVWKGKCSAFGRVITARQRPVPRPYVKRKMQTTIVPFDFSTKSPCDIIKERLRRPTCNMSYTPDILGII